MPVFLDLIAPPKAHDLKHTMRNYFWLLPKNQKLVTTTKGGDLIYPFLWDARKVEYFKSKDEIPLNNYDAALFAQSEDTSENIVKIGQELCLWRKEKITLK
jgi:hypothetical protein